MRKKRSARLCMLRIALLILLGAGCAKEEKQVLYENSDPGFGLLLPEGYTENPFAIEEEDFEGETVIHFLEPESGAMLFSLCCMDADLWNDEVQESFSAPYTELYRDDAHILLCLDVTDVQYDPEDAAQQARYQELLALKNEVCDSLYILE